MKETHAFFFLLGINLDLLKPDYWEINPLHLLLLQTTNPQMSCIGWFFYLGLSEEWTFDYFLDIDYLFYVPQLKCSSFALNKERGV